MKEKSTDDPALKNAMSAWRVDVELPPQFQADVWRRIRQNEERRMGRWSWLAQTLEWLAGDSRLAVALPTLALAVGLLLGLWNENAAGRDPRTQFQVAYIDSLDPYTLAVQHMGGR